MATAVRLRTAGWHDDGRDTPRLAGAAACAALLHASLGALVLLGPWRVTPAPVLPEGVTIEIAALASAGEDHALSVGTTEDEAADISGELAAPAASPPTPQQVPPAPAMPVPPPSQLAAAAIPPPAPMQAVPALVPLDLALPPPVGVPGDIAPAPPSTAEIIPAPQPAPAEAPHQPSPSHAAKIPSVVHMPDAAIAAPRETAVADALPLPPPVMPAPPPVAAARPPSPSRATERLAPRGVADGMPEARPLARGGGPESPAAGGAVPSDDPPLIVAPRFRRTPRPPEYPRRAVELDLTGTVVVRALLDPEGDPRETRVHRSSGHPLLDGAALAAVRGWAFQPAARNGQRIPAWVEVPVHFRLH